MSNLISYINLLDERNRFRKSGGLSSSDFNTYDTPAHKYFKVFFYFDNGDVTGEQSIDAGNGLLSPTWLLKGLDDKTYYLYNSAWSYLSMNDEPERAELLKNFVNLLSNISAESPWYFSELTGLESAVERKAIMAENFNIDVTRPKITLKCLQDAADDRIGTLLDLYRAVVWDWKSKREVLPSNLRKFDMGILVFETATNDLNMYNATAKMSGQRVFDKMLNTNLTERTSYKYFELHNCEIDYNSTKNPISQLNNKEGTSVEYNIEIHFDDCYETRYNKFLMKEFGDFVFTSENNGVGTGTGIKSGQLLPNAMDDVKLTHETLPGHPGSPDPAKKGWLQNAVDQLVQTGKGFLESKLKSAVMGNLYTFSLTRIGDQLTTLANGDVLSTARNAAEYIRDAKQRQANQLNNLNIFNDDKVLVTANGSMGDIKGEPKDSYYSTMSNINNIKGELKDSHYSAMSDINNIKGEPKNSHYCAMSDINNINEKPIQSLYTNSQNIGNIATKKRILPKVKYIGNLYEGNTIANNI